MKYLLALVIIFIPSLGLAQSKGPVAFIEKRVFDFGQVREGELVEASFRVFNKGDKLLEIHDIIADCGCTVPEPKKAKILPGQTQTFKASFNTSGFEGKKTKSLRVYTNDPLNRSLVFTFDGKVVGDLEFKPSRLSFGELSKKSLDTVSKELLINTRLGGKIKVKDVTSRSPHLNIETLERLEEGGIRVRVSFKSSVGVGLFKSNLVVRSSSPNRPVENIPVFAMIQGDLYFKPTDVNFGLLQGPLVEEKRKQAILVNNLGRSVRIESVESKNDWLLASILETKSNGDILLELKLRKGTYGAIHSEVKVKTSHPDPEQAEVSLPIYGIITKKGK